MGENEISEKPNTTTGVTGTLAPLDVSLDDDKLLKYISGLEELSEKHWNSKEINLKARRKQNIRYLFGRQLHGLELKKYDSKFVDNVIYEFEGTLKSLAVSKMPDILVKAGGIGRKPERQLTADLLTEFLDKIIKGDVNKQQLGMMFKHMPAYLIACKKYRWDAGKNNEGDYVEEVINPDNILLDHTATSSNPDEMQYIIHYVEKTAKEWAMLFPKKEKKIIEYLKTQHVELARDSKDEDVLMAQKIRVAECWYDWFDKAKDFDVDKPRFEFHSGVAWKLSETVLLGKSKNPNWDYEGHDVPMVDGQIVPPQILEQMILTGQQPEGFKIKKVYNNYFKNPKKPFIFMTFDQFLLSAIDETSRIEQVIPMQASMDDVERQNDYMVKTHKGKHLWSGDSGIDKKDIGKLDMNNPDQDIVIPKGDVRAGHAFIQPVMPTPESYKHIRDRRERMFAKVGAHGATRGELTTSVATSNQISREADFTKNDDLVNDTILHVAIESVKARLHMMKLRYTEEHFKRIAGTAEGEYLHMRITNDSIDDGMEVEVTASTSDKLRAERNAQQMAQLKLIDPYYFYKDTGVTDPEGRAEALYLFSSNPALWYEQIVKGKDVSQLAQQVILNAGQPPQQAQQPMQPQQAPVQPSPQNTASIATTPAGSPNILQRATSGIRNMIGV